MLRFGAFEFDVRAGELRKRGMRIKLREQPIQILEMLVANPGEVVLREEIRLRLWPDNTTVAFDQAINVAILRLRSALGESADQPRYIETVARRGYRFKGDVESVGRQTEEDVANPAQRAVPIPPAGTARRWLAVAWLVVPLLIAGAWIVRQGDRPSGPPPRVVPLTSYQGSETWPSFSPDGRQVAFSWNGPNRDNRHIYVKVIGETGALRITGDPADDVCPAWSPDGKWIAFGRSAPQRPGALYVVSPLGGTERKVADFAGSCQTSWSPDGKWLALARAQPIHAIQSPQRDPAIYLLPVNGGEPRQITHPAPGGHDGYPAYDRTGHTLAYASCRRQFACDFFLQELDSNYEPHGRPRRITNQQISPVGIAWDGDSLIYGGSMSTGILPYLWRVSLRGNRAPERLELAGVNAIQPAVTRTGDRLAFSRSTRNYDIWRYQMGGGPPKLLIASSLDDLCPQFSPDGRRIVFGSDRSGESYDLWIVNADGSNPVQLTNQLARGDGAPRWSPDGRQIVFDSQRADGAEEICVIDASSGRLRHLTPDSFQNTLPSWSHDGRWIYFNSDRTGRGEIWRIPSSGGQAEQITDNGGSTSFESVDGKTLYYTKGLNTRLFARPLAGGPERQVLDIVGASRDFAVFEDGIYYGGRSEKGQTPVFFYEFSSGKSRLITRFEGDVFNGFTVSPDRKTILFATDTGSGSDLMLIENFR